MTHQFLQCTSREGNFTLNLYSMTPACWHHGKTDCFSPLHMHACGIINVLLMVCFSSVCGGSCLKVYSYLQKRSLMLPNIIIYVVRLVRSECVAVANFAPYLSRPSAIMNWCQTVSLLRNREPLVGIRGWLELWLLCNAAWCVFVKYYNIAVSFCLFQCLSSFLCIPMRVSHMIN